MPHFTEEQLQELSTIFGLKKVEDVLPVRAAPDWRNSV